MPDSSDALDQLSLLMNQAGLDDSVWHRAVRQVTEFVGTPSGVLFSPVPGLADPLLAGSSGDWLQTIAEYAARWIEHDPWIHAVEREGRFVAAGEVLAGNDLLAQSAYEKTPFFNDFGRRVGINQMLSLRIADGGADSMAPPTMVALHRPDATPFQPAERRRLAACLPHLRRGVETHWAFRRARQLHGAVEATLDGMPQAVWVLRADGWIDHANAAARELTRGAPWISTTHGRLTGLGDVSRGALLLALTPRRGEPARTLTALCVERGVSRRAVLRIAPLQSTPPYALAWPQAKALLSLELPPAPEVTSSLARLAALHGLTPAEQRVLERLAAGDTVEAIADEQSVARSTVRTHLRALFDKLGVRRQADLVRLALGA